MRGVIAHAARGDLTKTYPELFQAWVRAGGKPPVRLQVDQIKPVPAPTGGQCVVAEGRVDPEGRGMQRFGHYMCVTPGVGGINTVYLNASTVPEALAEQERPTVQAIINSWKVDQAVLQQMTERANRQAAAHTQMLIRRNQQAVARIHQIGEQATRRMQATQAANEAQHAGYWAQQDSNARRGQGFSNYLLDQTVVQDNNICNNGTVGHGTVWNSTADALIKADPNRFEAVDTPNYWRGIDY